MTGTTGEAIHALDGIYGHVSGADLSTLHVDGGGVSDIVFAVMHLLGLSFEPRIPRLSDRRLYAFEPPRRYGRLAPLFGRRLDRDLIAGHWDEIGQVVRAVRERTVTPSLILKKLSAYHQQNSLAAALREVGRIERTLFTLRWYEDPKLRRLVTAELNKGEARNSLARAVAFDRLGRFRDRGLENQRTRAAALTLVTAAIILFNCRYLGRAIDELQRLNGPIDPTLIAQLSPLGWDRINLTGDYVWSDAIQLNTDGLMPLETSASNRANLINSSPPAVDSDIRANLRRDRRARPDPRIRSGGSGRACHPRRARRRPRSSSRDRGVRPRPPRRR